MKNSIQVYDDVISKSVNSAFEKYNENKRFRSVQSFMKRMFCSSQIIQEVFDNAFNLLGEGYDREDFIQIFNDTVAVDEDIIAV